MHRWGNESRHARGYGSSWDRQRPSIFRRDRYLCVTCLTKGRVSSATSVDHVVPKAKGGTDEPSNLQSVCSPCHTAKSLQEAAEAQGREYRKKQSIGKDGWPVSD